MNYNTGDYELALCLINKLEENGMILSEALLVAREAIQKQIPAKPLIEEWNPAKCPMCDCDLSDSKGDGYYKHRLSQKICDCGQKLDWGDQF